MAILLDPSCSFKAVIAEYIIWQNKKSKSRLELYMKQEKKNKSFFCLPQHRKDGLWWG
jgi:hypothetical protein